MVRRLLGIGRCRKHAAGKRQWIVVTMRVWWRCGSKGPVLSLAHVQHFTTKQSYQTHFWNHPIFFPLSYAIPCPGAVQYANTGYRATEVSDRSKNTLRIIKRSMSKTAYRLSLGKTKAQLKKQHPTSTKFSLGPRIDDWELVGEPVDG